MPPSKSASEDSMFQCKYLGSLLWVTQKELINGHFFSFRFVTFFSFSFDTLNQYCYILCLMHQFECINVSVMIMYISNDIYNYYRYIDTFLLLDSS